MRGLQTQNGGGSVEDCGYCSPAPTFEASGGMGSNDLACTVFSNIIRHKRKDSAVFCPKIFIFSSLLKPNKGANNFVNDCIQHDHAGNGILKHRNTYCKHWERARQNSPVVLNE